MDDKEVIQELTKCCQFMLSLLKCHVHETDKVWRKLAEENNFKWIDKLSVVEKFPTVIGTVIIPKNGVSQNPKTNKRVIKWLRKNKVRPLCVETEIQKLQDAAVNLKGSKSWA